MMTIGNDWDEILAEEMEQEYYRTLRAFLAEEYRRTTVYPERENIFNAFRHTPYEKTRVLILGQDPYHESGQAHGLAFSVQKGVPQPRSLVNIFREMQTDLGLTPPPRSNGCLIPWAESGVLLLNTVLTVREHEANSHKGRGWERLTDRVIGALNEREQPLVFILWGRNAAAKMPLITNKRHLVLTGAHPSPLSAQRGFFGGRYFSRSNEFLIRNGSQPVDWAL